MKRKVSEEPASFYCRGCTLGKSAGGSARRNFKGKIRKTTHIGKIGTTIICGGLTKHLFHANYAPCLAHYIELGLLSSDKKHVDYTTSLRNTRLVDEPNTTRKTGCYTAEQIGLTLTANGPASIQVTSKPSNKQDINSVLNKQVMYNPFSSAVPRSAIESMKLSGLEAHHNPDNDSDSSEDEVVIDNEEWDESDSSKDDSEERESPDDHSSVSNDCKSSDTGTFEANDSDTPKTTLRITQTVPSSGVSPQLAAEITLMNLITKYRMPLCALKTIVDWAKTCQNRIGFDFCTAKSARRREKIFEDIHHRLNLPTDDVFIPKLIDWLPDNKPATVFHRPFINALNSLLSNNSLVKEGNFSFPDNKTPFSSVNTSQSSTHIIEELHHGKWWSRTWQSKCEPDSSEILVPIILYMDGISLDAHGRLTLTPLNMTLGIFNVATRAKRPDAWETIYWHPDKNFLSADHSNTPTSQQNIQNLHNGLELALRSFKEACELQEGVLWDGLPYAGKIWNGVKMKFAIAYVVGDTELHDRLCGRYICYNGAISKICRHCNIKTIHASLPQEQHVTQLWTPSDFVCTSTRTENDKEYWKSVSHHPIKNAFHELDFGCNPNNIHMATPGECLHMHQLGVAKRAVESITDFVFGRTIITEEGETKVRAKRKVALEALTELTRNYGAKLTRQSDRDFPRTKFTSNILQPAKKEGSDYAGILLSLVVTLSSDEGKHILTTKAAITEEQIEKLIYTLELILGMEEFLKHGRISPDDIPKLKKMIDHFLTEINENLKRKKGMGTNLIKNHLYFHVPKYIELWGPPAGWDSAPNESNHKTEIKAPSKNTQKNASTFIEQTGKRITEKRMIERATHMFGLDQRDKHHAACSEKVCGSKFRITRDKNNNPIMEWEKKENNLKSHHNKDVLHFCCEQVLPLLSTDHVWGFTEHYRIGGEDETQYLFRSTPSFMSSGGQLCNVWYDWALFDVEGDDNEGIPAQIVCLLNITSLNIPEGEWGEKEGKPDCADGYPVRTNSQYAIVRKFTTEAKRRIGNDKTKIVWTGKIDNQLYLFPCDSINREIAVVQNTSIHGASENFFVIRNRNDWLYNFQSQIFNMRL